VQPPLVDALGNQRPDLIRHILGRGLDRGRRVASGL
jgi:hypothetical protein